MPLPFLLPVLGAAVGAVIGMVIGKEIDNAICKGEIGTQKCPKCKSPLTLLMIKDEKGKVLLDQSEIEQVKIRKNTIFAPASLIGALGFSINIKEKMRLMYVWHCNNCDFTKSCTVDDVSIDIKD